MFSLEALFGCFDKPRGLDRAEATDGAKRLPLNLIVRDKEVFYLIQKRVGEVCEGADLLVCVRVSGHSDQPVISHRRAVALRLLRFDDCDQARRH